MNTQLAARRDFPPGQNVLASRVEFDIVDTYCRFRNRFRTWAADRQRHVIALAWERWRVEPDPELHFLIADMANDLETLVWRAGNADVAPQTN